MTKNERILLETLRGLGLALPQIEKPAAASPLAAWVAEARATTAPVKVEPIVDRPWTFVGTGQSNSGRPTAVFSAPMKNGGTFQATLPADLVKALREGKVLGLK